MTSLPQATEKKLGLVIDLDTSLRYRDGHVPGAWFAVRAGLGKTIADMRKQQAGATRIVLVSPDGEIDAFAAPEAEEAMYGLPVAILVLVIGLTLLRFDPKLHPILSVGAPLHALILDLFGH